MTFRPSIHGWPFSTVEGPGASALGLGAPPTGQPGLGGGLCWAALDRYRLGIEIPRDTPDPEAGDPLHAELVRRHIEAQSGVWGRVRDWQSRPDASWRDHLPVRVVGGGDLASLSRGEWRGIRSRLERDEPVLLTLLGRTDAYRRGHAAWQVLATGWKRDKDRIVVSVYDPDRPNDDKVALSFERAGALQARLSGGREVRGFFAVPYDRESPTTVRAETFGDRSVLGLNRPVRGRVAALAGRRRIELVARDPDGAIVYFTRDRGRSWEGTNITDRDQLGGHELHSDPAAVHSGGTLHAFARSYVGDLLHFREGSPWRVTNLTDQKRTGPRFRLTGTPIALSGPWRRISVLGIDKDGGLVHYTGQPVVGWSAEQVAGEHMRGQPVATWVDDTLHVAGLSGSGSVLHWSWDGKEWSPLDLGAAGGPAESLKASGSLALRADAAGRVHLAARSWDRRLMILTRSPEGTWTVHDLAGDVAGDPILTEGPTGLHVFARTMSGGLLHGWSGGKWRVEEVTGSRPTLGELPSGDSLTGWGSEEELRVWIRAERDLWTVAWRPDADWTVDRLTHRAGVADRHRPGDDPVVLAGPDGQPHLFFTDGKGTVVHVESSEWREPGQNALPGKAGGTTTRRKEPSADELPPEPPTPEPLPLLNEEEQPEPEVLAEEPEVPEEAELQIVREPEPEVLEKAELEIVREPEPEDLEEAELEIVREPEPEPEILAESESEVVEEAEEAEPETSEVLVESTGSVASEGEAEDPAEAGEPEAGEPEAGEPEAGEPEAGEPEAGEPEPDLQPLPFLEALSALPGGDESERAGVGEQEKQTSEASATDADAPAAASAEDQAVDEGEESPDELPYLDFEADGPPSAARPTATNGTSPKASGPAAPESASPEPEDRAPEEDRGADGEPAEAPSSDGSAVPDMEPMDLELLHTWPPPSPSARRRKKKKKQKKDRKKGS